MISLRHIGNGNILHLSQNSRTGKISNAVFKLSEIHMAVKVAIGTYRMSQLSQPKEG